MAILNSYVCYIVYQRIHPLINIRIVIIVLIKSVCLVQEHSAYKDLHPLQVKGKPLKFTMFINCQLLIRRSCTHVNLGGSVLCLGK